MKLKAFSVLFVFILGFAFVDFALAQEIPPKPYPQTPIPGYPHDDDIDEKLEEIMCMLNMHRKHDVLPPTQAQGYWKKLKDVNELTFYKTDADGGAEIPTAAAINSYWKNLTTKSTFQFKVISVVVEEENQGPGPFNINKKATVKIEYSINPTGSITFTLRHMRRCEWD
jgi:hypothetical protein